MSEEKKPAGAREAARDSSQGAGENEVERRIVIEFGTGARLEASALFAPDEGHSFIASDSVPKGERTFRLPKSRNLAARGDPVAVSETAFVLAEVPGVRVDGKTRQHSDAWILNMLPAGRRPKGGCDVLVGRDIMVGQRWRIDLVGGGGLEARPIVW